MKCITLIGMPGSGKSTIGVLRTDSNGALALSDSLTRADAAELLAGALDLLEARESGGLFG